MGIGLEIPVFGAKAAFTAVELGAARIELNAVGSYPAGGLTPTLQDVEQVTKLNVPVRIMIRPRGPPSPASISGSKERDFIYSDDEYAQMEQDIRRFKDSNLLNLERGDGFVFGILEEEPVQYAGSLRAEATLTTQTSIIEAPSSLDRRTQVGNRRCWVDKNRCSRLVHAARPFKVVFHRAFDEIVNCEEVGTAFGPKTAWKNGLDDLKSCGFDAVLTSGGLGNAIQNVNMLDQIIAKAETIGIEIIVGGGVRRVNVGDLMKRLKLRDKTQPTFLHSACLSRVATEDIDVDEARGMLIQLD